MINWESFNNDLKNVKSKYLLIFKFFNLIKYLDDEITSKMLRIIINHSIDLFIEYPFYKLSNHIPTEEYPETLTVLVTFYELIKEKSQLILFLSKWYTAYQNKSYWNRDNKYQIEHLLNLQLQVKAIFDSVICNQSFGMKIIPIIKANINNSKYLVFENVIERLIKLYKLLGQSFFKTANIPIITVDDFYNLNDGEKIIYVISTQSITLNMLEENIKIYENFNMVNLKLDNLLNPFSINIENDTCTDYDVEDIKDFL